MIKKFLLISLLNFILCISLINAKPCCRVYGYLGSWSAPSGWTLDSIDWDALTHVLDAFAIPDSYGGVSTSQLRLSPLVTKAHSKNTRCMFSVGGATGSGGFATSTNSTYRTTFVNNLINIMTTYGYDGIDIDWEFPRSWDKSNFMAFMQQLYNAVKSSGNGYDGQPRELTFYTTTGWYDDGVDWGTIGNYVDYAIQSGYDWGNPANAPLRNTGTLTSAAGYTFENSIHGFATSIIGRGFPRAKFILGLPFYSKPGDVNWGNHGTFSSYNTTYAEGSYSGQWFTDNQGYTDKLQYLRNESRPGIAIWEISQIYPLTDLWNTIKTQSCAGGTPTLTFTPTRTSTPTNTRTNTLTNTITFTRTNTPTNTSVNTNTFTGTATYTRTNTPTSTSTYTVTGTPPTSTFTFTVTNTATITPTPVVTPIRVNCGGTQYTGSDGRVWQADKAYVAGSWGYVGGQVGTDSTPGEVLNTVDDTLYYTERFDNPTYRFDVPNGQYTIILYFSEFYYTAAGQRVFSVYIEGVAVLTNYDIIADTGGPDRAVAKQFTVNITDGRIDITSTSTVDLAKFSAIEIIQGTLTPTPTNTATSTLTSTRTLTFTNTITYTNTRTSTNTVTATQTNTSTLTFTVTRTNTQTGTVTNTNTRTFTATVTNTPTDTGTLTFTATRTTTFTNTITHTATRTFTITNTATATMTFSSTFTPTETVTGSQPPTWTPTDTFTLTHTPSLTNTATNTLSFTASFTATFTSTTTGTQTFTITDTITGTVTFTATPTYTRTATFTYTFTKTMTETQVLSFTYTGTNTPTNTYTFTQTFTRTFINTATFTRTMTNTIIQTFTATFTETPTPSITLTPFEAEKLEIINDSFLFYPHPYNYTGKPYLKFILSKSAESFTMKIYTVSFRYIKELTGKQLKAGINDILLDNFPELANGTYYYLIIVKDRNYEIKSKINKLIILK